LKKGPAEKVVEVEKLLLAAVKKPFCFLNSAFDDNGDKSLFEMSKSSISARVVLPIPGSPEMTTTRPRLLAVL
jgi:hypothetical protein